MSISLVPTRYGRGVECLQWRYSHPWNDQDERVLIVSLSMPLRVDPKLGPRCTESVSLGLDEVPSREPNFSSTSVSLLVQCRL